MSGWEVRFSNSRHVPYFYNPATSQSVWQPPSELSPEQINALPGAAKYLRQPGGGAGGGVRGDQGAAGDGGGKEGQARASHILCKHAGSRRPSSWREVSGGGGVDMTLSYADIASIIWSILPFHLPCPLSLCPLDYLSSTCPIRCLRPLRAGQHNPTASRRP